MANKKPLVLNNGLAGQLQSGDTLVDGSNNPIGGKSFIDSDNAKSANFSVVTGDKGKIFQVTTGSSTITATLPAAATAGDNWYCFFQKFDAGSGLVASSPAENPTGTLALMDQGDLALVWSDGTQYNCVIFAASITGMSKLALSGVNDEVLARLNLAVLVT